MKNKLKNLVNIPDVCPITGLKYKTNPNWSYYSDNYALNVGLLGDKIILPYEAGNVDLNTTKIYCQKVQQIIDDNNLMDTKFIVIEDYTFIKTINNDGKDYFINFYQNKQSSLIGVYFIGLTKLLKFTIGIIKHLPIVKAELSIFKTIEEAQLAAFKKLKIEYKKVNDFNIVKEGIEISLSVFNKKIIYSKVTGFISEEVVPEVIQKLENLLKLIDAENGHFRIIDYTELRGGSDKARMTYLSSLIKLNKKYPLIAYIVVAPPKNIKTIITLSKPLVSFDVDFADNVEHAYDKIKQYDRTKKYTQKISSKKIKFYLNEILDAFNEINITDYLDKKITFSKDNPYVDIFNSYDIIKRDFNFLLDENEKLSLNLETLKKEKAITDDLNKKNLQLVKLKFHEVINSISAYIQLILEQTDIPSNTYKYLNKIQYNTSYFDSIITDLAVLDFEESKLQETNIKEIFEETNEIFSNVCIECVINFVEGPNYITKIYIDKQVYKQIITNIIAYIINKTTRSVININYTFTDKLLEIKIKTNDNILTHEQIMSFNSIDKNYKIQDINLGIIKSLTFKLGNDILVTQNNGTTFFLTTKQTIMN